MKKPIIFLLLIITVYLANGLFAISRLSITADEGAHLNYAIRIIKGNPERVNAVADNSKMPVSVLNAIPRIFQQLFNRQLIKNDNGQSDVINGRYITLFFSVLIILLVYQWAKGMYGINAGLLSAFLFSWCPNNLAAATLVTTDSYSVFFLMATLYCLYKWVNSQKLKHFVLFAIMIALSQLAKQSLFHLYPLSAIITGIYFLQQKAKVNIRKISYYSFIVIAISFVIINAGFLFHKMFIPIGSYHFKSDLFISVQHILPYQFPVPFSKAFIDGMDMAKYYDQLGGGFTGNPESSFGNVTISGKSSTGGSFWYYYFVSIFYKTPVSFFILIGWALFFSFKNRFKKFFTAEWFLVSPVVYFLLLMSFFYKTQCGLRHILFIYPLLIIYSSSFLIFIKKNSANQILLGLLCIWLIISVSLYKGNFFAYTNEFIWNKTMAYKKVGAANINFSQGYLLLNEFLQDHKDVKYVTAFPESGNFVISVDEYLDIWNTGKYRWIRNMEPYDNVANGCFLLIHVK